MLADVRKRWEQGLLRGMANTRRMLAESSMRENNGEVTDEALHHFQMEVDYLKEATYV